MLPIVLIHGFPFDASMWHAQAEFLRAKGHTVLTPNLPGFGGTPALPRDRTSMESYASFIHDLIQNEADAGGGGGWGAKAIVAGFSMGGYVLLALLRDFPDAVAAAMLIDTRPDADSPDTRANRMKSIAEIELNGPAKVFDAMLPKILSKKPAPAIRDHARAIMDRQTDHVGLANALNAMAKRRDQSDLLPLLKIPTLVIVGSEDSLTPPSVALAMQSHMPHAMVAQIVSAGHLSPLEQPTPINTTLETFLTTIHSPTPT